MRRAITVLPEKWAVKSNSETHKSIRDWIHSNRTDSTLVYGVDYQNDLFWHFPEIKTSSGRVEGSAYCEKKEVYIEITFDEFRHLVLGELKLVGFKAPYEYKSNDGTVFLQEGELINIESQDGAWYYIRRSYGNFQLNCAEVERWEPVYEEVVKPIEESHINSIAEANGLDPALIKAVAEVEGLGSGFFEADGSKYIRVLYEGHRMYAELKKKTLMFGL